MIRNKYRSNINLDLLRYTLSDSPLNDKSHNQYKSRASCVKVCVKKLNPKMWSLCLKKYNVACMLTKKEFCIWKVSSVNLIDSI
jgi:hypothetical protein